MKLNKKHLETQIKTNQLRLELHYKAITEIKQIIKILSILKNKI